MIALRTGSASQPIEPHLAERIEAFVALDRRPSSFVEVVAEVSSLCIEIERSEEDGTPAEAIRTALRPARAIHRRSGFIRRLQEWPRGYPGDFETIDMLLDAPLTTNPGTVERHLERYAYDCPAAQQHRNKIRWQADAVAEVAHRRGTGGRILVLACGGARDLLSVAPTLELVGCPELVLNDADLRALATTRTRLEPTAESLRMVPGNALQVVRRRDIGRFDLVLMGGLADYLTDRQLRFLIRTIQKRLLRPGGHLRLTNMATGNPYRSWISYLGDWHLRERSRSDLEALVDGTATIEADRSGLSLLVKVGAA